MLTAESTSVWDAPPLGVIAAAHTEPAVVRQTASMSDGPATPAVGSLARRPSPPFWAPSQPYGTPMSLQRLPDGSRQTTATEPPEPATASGLPVTTPLFSGSGTDQ